MCHPLALPMRLFWRSVLLLFEVFLLSLADCNGAGFLYVILCYNLGSSSGIVAVCISLKWVLYVFMLVLGIIICSNYVILLERRKDIVLFTKFAH